jgi:putative sterol carrier protein
MNFESIILLHRQINLEEKSMAQFPTAAWVQALEAKLNSDEKYAKIAHNWEGDILFVVQPGGNLTQGIKFYLDLWHGKCRSACVVGDQTEPRPTFTLNAPYENVVRLLQGELEPMQALLTRKLAVQGNMAVLMRNVPTMLDFVRCCREVTDSFV